MTAPQDELARIREYLQKQAAEKSIEELIERVQQGADELHEAARSIAPEAFAVVPAGESWSPADCMIHVVDWNMTNAQQVLFIALSGEFPESTGQTVPTDRDELIAKNQEALDSLYEHVRSADPEAYLDVKWEHPMFGDLNWREWLIFLRIHCKDHAGQLRAMA